MSALIDSHCHLQEHSFDKDREECIQRALADLAGLIVVGDQVSTSQGAMELTQNRIHAAVGVHPHHAATLDAKALSAIEEMARHPGVVAIGEIGLDYYYEFTDHDTQQDAFRLQLDLAVTLGLPVVVHCRDALQDMASILDDYHARLAGIMMHCFSGDVEFAQRCLAWGSYISFAGNLTYPKALSLREAAKTVPLDRLLVETDSPYLAPQPVRGKRCEPQYVAYTAEVLAELKGASLDTVAENTTANAQRLFNIK